MSLQPGAPPSPRPTDSPNTQHFTDIETFIKALTQPTEGVYERIAEDTPPSNGVAYRWIFGFALLGAIITEAARIPGAGDELFIIWYTAIPNILITPFVTVIGIAVGVWCRQWIARRLDGVGNYGTLLYVYAAQTAPLLVVNAVVNAIPAITVLGVPLMLYALYLTTLSIKVAHQFSWVKAFLTATVITVIAIAIVYLFNWQLRNLF